MKNLLHEVQSTDNILVVTSLQMENNEKIVVNYEVSGKWSRYFTEKPFYTKYSTKLKNSDYAISIIPFLGTVLPLAWICHATVKVKSIDKAFYDALPNIRKGFEKMYKQIEFGGKVETEEIKEFNKNIKSKKDGSFFSGGADGTHTFIKNVDTISDIFTVIGADVPVKKVSGGNRLIESTKKFASDFNVTAHFIHVNFWEVINKPLANKLTKQIASVRFWNGFHHGTGLICLSAPLCATIGLNKIFFPSSFAREYECASIGTHPDIDNNIYFANATVVHYDYNISRTQKMKDIVEFYKDKKEKPFLRVCFTMRNGTNCCFCEKCYRTAIGLRLADADPADYGLPGITEKKIKHMRRNLFVRIGMQMGSPYYFDLKDAIKAKYPSEVPDYLKPLHNYKFKSKKRHTISIT